MDLVEVLLGVRGVVVLGQELGLGEGLVGRVSVMLGDVRRLLIRNEGLALELILEVLVSLLVEEMHDVLRGLLVHVYQCLSRTRGGTLDGGGEGGTVTHMLACVWYYCTI